MEKNWEIEDISLKKNARDTISFKFFVWLNLDFPFKNWEYALGHTNLILLSLCSWILSSRGEWNTNKDIKKQKYSLIKSNII